MLSLLSMQALAAKDYVGVQSIARDAQKFSAVSIVSVSKWKMEIWIHEASSWLLQNVIELNHFNIHL